jgi:hypothetical protein
LDRRKRAPLGEHGAVARAQEVDRQARAFARHAPHEPAVDAAGGEHLQRDGAERVVADAGHEARAQAEPGRAGGEDPGRATERHEHRGVAFELAEARDQVVAVDEQIRVQIAHGEHIERVAAGHRLNRTMIGVDPVECETCTLVRDAEHSERT